MEKISIIGSGFSSLSAACYMAKEGCSVTVFEKNRDIGGRARQFKRKGFTFDVGPTFYWMPDVFEKFFGDFGKSPSDYYKLVRLDPGYEIYFKKGTSIRLSSDFEKIVHVFENKEKGSGKFLRSFMKDAEYNYGVAINKVVYQPGDSALELVMPSTISRLPQFYSSLSHQIRRHIKSPELRQILEFPVLFLGAKPSDIPAFYCFMNYADMKLGTWHIEGGMYELVKGLQQLAESLGVKIRTDSPVRKIDIQNGKAKGIFIEDKFEETDLVISGADYAFSESLIDKKYRNYSDKYWDTRVMAPSALLYYIGFDKKVENISHHTLFFDASFDEHAEKIYNKPDWPETPLFYASFPSKTDRTLAPEGKETAIILIPVASGLTETDELKKYYFRQIIERMEKLTKQSLKDHILFYNSYATSDFIHDYNAYKGNAYGLSNILLQTAFLKPKVRNKKVENLFYTGQLTVPGPGVPSTLISGKIASDLALSYLNKTNHK